MNDVGKFIAKFQSPESNNIFAGDVSVISLFVSHYASCKAVSNNHHMALYNHHSGFSLMVCIW